MKWDWLREEGTGFALLLVLVLGNTGLAHYNTLGLVQTEQRVARTHAALTELEAVQASLRDAEAEQRSLLLTGDARHLPAYEEARGHTVERLGLLQGLATDHPDPQRFLADLATLEQQVTARLDDLGPPDELRRGPGLKVARQAAGADRGRESAAEVRRLVGHLKQEQLGFLEQRAGEAAEQVRDVKLANLTAALASIALVAGAFTLMWRGRLARRRHEAELRRSEGRARRLSDSDVAGVCYWTADGRVTWANDEFLRVIGGGPADLEAGRLHWDGLSPPGANARAAAVWAGLRRGHLRPQECELLRLDGVRVPVIVGGALFDGSDTEGVAFVLDNSARKRLEADLRQQAAALAEADRRKDEFLLMLAHELRNPLAPVRNAAHLLRMGPSAESDQRWAVDVIDRQTRRLARLIDDLLDVARITRGQLQIRRGRVDLRAVVEEAIETSRPALDAGGHELTVALPVAPIVLDGDAARLVQVLANLLDNAAKYTPRGGHIALKVSAEDGQAVLRVGDNGIGIPDELLPRVFEPFIQAEQALDRARGGLGVGLTLVRQLVELHGGTVAAHSDGPGTGSEFVVRLPLAKAE